MKRKGITILLIVIVAFVVSCNIYVYTGTKKAEKLIWEYLDQKGYAPAEIQSIDINHSFLNVVLSYNEWNIVVIYTDESTSIYDYHMKDGNIIEGGVSGTTEKENLKH